MTGLTREQVLARTGAEILALVVAPDDGTYDKVMAALDRVEAMFPDLAACGKHQDPGCEDPECDPD